MSGRRLDVGRNSDPYDMGEVNGGLMTAFTLPCDSMIVMLCLAEEDMGSKMNEVGLMVGSSVDRTCLMDGMNCG